MNENKNLAVAALVVTAILWGIVWYPYRVIDSVGVGGAMAMLSANLIGFTLLNCIFPHAWREFQKEPLILGVLAISVGLGNLTYIFAILSGNVIRVLLLFYLSPLWVVPLARLILNEKITTAGYATIVVALCGAMIILWNPSIGLPLPMNIAEWLGVFAGFCFALANVLVRRAANTHISGRTWSAFLGTILAGGLAVMIQENSVPQINMVYDAMPLIILIGVMMIIMSLTAQYGLAKLPAIQANIILLLELVVATFAACLLTEETIGIKELLGGLLILIASVFTDSVKDKKPVELKSPYLA